MKIKYRLPNKKHPQHENITNWKPEQLEAFLHYLNVIHNVENFEYVWSCKNDTKQ